MRTIKVSATDSTNSFLRELHRRDIFSENLCLVAKNQTKGRGQRGAGWDSEPGKNLTFSLLLQGLQLPAQQHFKLNAAVSLALVTVLEELKIEKLSVKWPNDILSGNRKIAGILIENILKNGNIKDSIVGVGLNVNQENFPGLPNAASLKSVTGRDFDLESLLKKLSSEIESKVFDCKNKGMDKVLKKYHKHLFRIGKLSDFELPSGEKIQGQIIGVSEEGKLLVDTKNEKKEFLLKEVKLLY